MLGGPNTSVVHPLVCRIVLPMLQLVQEFLVLPDQTWLWLGLALPPCTATPSVSLSWELVTMIGDTQSFGDVTVKRACYTWLHRLGSAWCRTWRCCASPAKTSATRSSVSSLFRGLGRSSVTLGPRSSSASMLCALGHPPYDTVKISRQIFTTKLT